jgi:CheY-like chemotaxis protein
MMPKMSGYECLFKIREKYIFKVVPVIMVSAKKQESDIVTGMKHGANDYICKPFSGAELISRMESHIRTYRQFLNRMDMLYRVASKAEFILPEHLHKLLKRVDGVDCYDRLVFCKWRVEMRRSTVRTMKVLKQLYVTTEQLVESLALSQAYNKGDEGIIFGHDRQAFALVELGQQLLKKLSVIDAPSAFSLKLTMHSGPMMGNAELCASTYHARILTMATLLFV